MGAGPHAVQRLERLIVGAGPAGSAAAIALAQAGLEATLVERTSAAAAGTAVRPCGEFISGEALGLLDRLGIDVAAHGAVPVSALRLVAGRTLIDAALPFAAAGLTRERLEAALRERAVAAGAALWRPLRAQMLALPEAHGRHGRHGRHAASAAGPRGAEDGFGLALHPTGARAAEPALHVITPALLLATGKTGLAPFRRAARAADDGLVGLQLHLALAREQREALAGRVEVFLLEHPHFGGYAGLMPVEGGLANLCLLARRTPRHAGIADLLAELQAPLPLLAERLHGARLVGAPRSIARVPYGFVLPAAGDAPPGLWRLGDQAAVIPSFTGDGIAIALASGRLAAGAIAAGATAADYQRRIAGSIGQAVRFARLVQVAGSTRPGRRAVLALLQRRPAALAFIASATRVAPTALSW